MTAHNHYLVWLEWPEDCFRTHAENLRFLRARVPKGSVIRWVRDEGEFLRRLPKATHVLVWYFKPEWFTMAPRLKVVATPAAGRELVPTSGPNGVRIHFGGFHGDFMAETVVAFVLAWARGILRVERLPICERKWPRVWLSDKCRDVAGSEAVILGYGKVGKAIGAKLEALGVTVHGFTRANLKTLPRFAAHADWLIMALPGDTGTDNLLDRRLIARLPSRCVVVNVGRGNSIDEPALFDALREGRLEAACLDVRKTEPYRRFNTEALPPTPKLDNLFLLPHASAFSPTYVNRFIQELQDDGCL